MSTQNRYQDNLEKEREQNRRKKRRLALGLGAGMLVLAAAGWFLLSGTISEKRYEMCISDRYYDREHSRCSKVCPLWNADPEQQ